MKIALVYDRVNKWGGAERVLLALHEIWPDAPLFTAVYNPHSAQWASVFNVHPSFLQYIPLAKNHHELFPWLTPMAFETFNFDEYDVVISVTSAEAKTIITKPHTMHVCYCLTPTRYLWSSVPEYKRSLKLGRHGKLGSKMYQYLLPRLQSWDLVGSSRPDYYIAISQHVEKRIQKYYRREVEAVIYPPVDIEKFQISKSKIQTNFKIQNPNAQNYFLLVSRLVGYKRVDIVVEAFNTLGWPLVIIGDGWEKRRLKNLAHKNITFIDAHLTDEELALYHQRCRAFVFAGEEDFGIVASEAQACGKPVIAYGRSGISEIVKDGITGILFNEQSSSSLIHTLKRFDTMTFSKQLCSESARRFSKDSFKHTFKKTIAELWTQYNTL